jgi:hypothetical protein
MLENELQVIKNFTPLSAKIYYDKNEDGIVVYYAVIIKDGKVNISKYPYGRIKYNVLNKDETVLCFKKILSKDLSNVKKLYLRYDIDTINLSNKDVILYEYIRDNCDTNYDNSLL